MSDQLLKPIIDRICKRAGLSPALVNSAAMRSVALQGYAISGDTTGQAALEQLMGLFQFYCTEADGRLRFELIANAPNAGVISTDDVGVLRSGNEDGGGVVTTSRESSLPRKVELTFSDPALTYRDNVAAAYRLTAHTEKVDRVSVPLVVPYERAEQICQAALAAAWAAQTTTEIQVPVQYSHIEAGDVVEFDGSLWRVSRVQFSAPLAIKLNLAKFSYAPFHAVTAPTTAPVVVARPAEKTQPVPVLLDVQLLSDDTDYSGFYVAAYEPVGTTSPGSATLAVQNVDGLFDAAATVPVGAVVGQLVTALPVGAATTWDAAASVHVRLLSTGALLSCTLNDALAGKNRVLIGSELCAYTTAQLDSSSGLYTLSGFVRGLGGEAPGAGVGAQLVVMTSSLVTDVPLPSAKTGVPQQYKLLGQGLPQAQAQAFSFTNTNQRIRPLKPAHLASAASAGGCTLTWVRQARRDYAWLEEADVPLDYARERYEVQLLDASGAMVGGGYTVENATQLEVALPAGAVSFRVRQLGDLLPGTWAVASIT